MKSINCLLALVAIIWIKPALANEVLITSTNTSLVIERLIPVGTTFFPNADQLLSAYSELNSRIIIRPADLQTSKVTTEIRKPLTRDEGMTAIRAVLAINGVTVINLGEKFVKLLSTSIGCGGTNSMAVRDYPTYVLQLPESVPTNLVASLKSLSTIPDFGILLAEKERLLIVRDQPTSVTRMIAFTKEWCFRSERH